MDIDFNLSVDRLGTNSVKWDYRKKIFDNEHVLPLWVADMDFPCPEPVTRAIQKRATHPIFGYPGQPDELFDALIQWQARRFGTVLQKEWLVTTPGVVPGIHTAVHALTRPGDGVVIQTPVYQPFFSAIQNTGRQVIQNPLKETEQGDYEMDFEDLEAKITPRTKVLILCHPHNPIGRVWRKGELSKLHEICHEKDITVVSDEIHSDLVFEKGLHTPYYSISETAKEESITFVAPSKTFNLAGLFSSMAIIPNEKLLLEFQSAAQQTGSPSMINTFGIEAFIAAYNEGEDWLETLLPYLEENAVLIHNFLKENMPEVKMRVPEATYLGWMDFRALGLPGEELNDWLKTEAGLGLNTGTWFGEGGDGFMRINFACPRPLLQQALDQLKSAYDKRTS